jgi:DNA-binding response OmpR family regulator
MESNNHKNKKILIADDDPAILEALQMMLEDEGYEVEISLEGKSIYKMKKNYPDLVLLDIWMSGIDGGDICMHLKKNKLTKHIPVIMISANKDVGIIAKGAGADDYISKPFQMHELFAVINKYMGN